jgi:hypothetical protein
VTLCDRFESAERLENRAAHQTGFTNYERSEAMRRAANLGVRRVQLYVHATLTKFPVSPARANARNRQELQMPRPRWLVRLLVAALVIMPAFAAHPADAPSNLDMLSNVDENEISAISGECQRSGGVLSCRFFQTVIARQKTAVEVEALVKEETAEFLKDVKAFQQDQLCSKDLRLKMVAEFEKRRADPSSAAKIAFAEQYMLPMFRVCDDPSAKNVETMTRAHVQREEMTCKVTNLRPYELTFQHQPDGRWISNDGPSGPCGTILITTLSREKDYSLWTYTQRRIITNKTGTLGVVQCSAFEDHTQVFSWRKVDKVRQCQAIKFGVN